MFATKSVTSPWQPRSCCSNWILSIIMHEESRRQRLCRKVGVMEFGLNTDGLDNVTWSQSVLYEWVVEDAEGEGQGRFKDIQTIEVTGARDWTHFTVDSYHFLVVATSSSSSSSMLSVSQQNSVIYFWQRGRFIPFQTIKASCFLLYLFKLPSLYGIPC